MDYPGFGLSEGLHGYIPSFDKLVDDVIEHYSKAKGTICLSELNYHLYHLVDSFDRSETLSNLETRNNT